MSKHQVYAVVRVDADTHVSSGTTGPGVHIQQFGHPVRDAVVHSILPTMDSAVAEVERLNASNASKGASYFWMATRYYPDGRQDDSRE